MRRPKRYHAYRTAVIGVIGLSVLAGCTTHRMGLSASDETARYLQNARGRYTIPGPPGDPWGPYIREASERFDVPESWVRALMRQESGGNLYRGGRLITSGAGAMGLMQVMPQTYRELRARHNLGPDPFDPHDNILAGVGYMREMYDMYGAPGFLAAYNAGPNRLDDYLANQRSLPDETRKYVAAIGPSLRHASPRVRSPAEQFAMNQLPIHIPPGPRFGFGTVPTIQLASAGTPAYTPPPVAAPAPAPRAVAWAEPPRPVFTPAPAPLPAPLPQGRSVAWAAPQPVYAPQPQPVYAQQPRPVYAPAPAQPQRVVVARAEPREEEEPAPARRVRETSRSPEPRPASTRVALLLPPPAPPSQHGGGLHLISSAMAAEVSPVRRGMSHYGKANVHAGHPGAAMHVRASGSVQPTGHGCHKPGHGKGACGAHT